MLVGIYSTIAIIPALQLLKFYYYVYHRVMLRRLSRRILQGFPAALGAHSLSE